MVDSPCYKENIGLGKLNDEAAIAGLGSVADTYTYFSTAQVSLAPCEHPSGIEGCRLGTQVYDRHKDIKLDETFCADHLTASSRNLPSANSWSIARPRLSYSSTWILNCSVRMDSRKHFLFRA